MDSAQSVQSLKDVVKSFLAERGWLGVDEYPKDFAMSIAIEAAELMEIFQWKSQQESLLAPDSPEYEHMKEELADVLAYCIRLALVMDVDLYDALVDKMKKNAIKYPVAVK